MEEDSSMSLGERIITGEEEAEVIVEVEGIMGVGKVEGDREHHKDNLKEIVRTVVSGDTKQKCVGKRKTQKKEEVDQEHRKDSSRGTVHIVANGDIRLRCVGREKMQRGGKTIIHMD